MSRTRSRPQQQPAPTKPHDRSPIIMLRTVVGVYGSEWFFLATKVVPFTRVPAVDERIVRLIPDDSDRYEIVESVTWDCLGNATVDLKDFDVPGDDEQYGRNVEALVGMFRNAGWRVAIPDHVKFPEPLHQGDTNET